LFRVEKNCRKEYLDGKTSTPSFEKAKLLHFCEVSWFLIGVRYAKMPITNHGSPITIHQHMAEIIRMPRMSDTMSEGNIIAWHKKEGDAIKPGDLLAEIETDKATMDFESLWEGQLLHIAIKEGSVPVEGVIAVIGKAGENWQSALQGSAASGQPQPEAAAATTPQPLAAVAAIADAAPQVEAASGDKRLKASPLAKSMAKEAGIDLSVVKGSGDNGRIVRRDVESLLETKEAQPAASPQVPLSPAIAVASEGNFEDKPLSQMRKTIARRLSESKFSAPHFYLTTEINMDKVVELRPKLNELAAPVKISFNDVVVKAVAVALQQHPAINSSWLGDRIRTNFDINVGVAVAVDEGLLVPVLRHTDRKSLSQINMEVKAFAEKARNRKLQPEEMSGNTFTISNLGMFDIDEFTAIINPPDACILAVGSIVQKAIVVNGEIKIGNMMKVTLSCDHRVVDGVTGAKFLQTLKGILEEPLRLIV
jgi:pyruvate dehydrogenase E2 component (dihydrolipoamide acetyltransferase)